MYFLVIMAFLSFPVAATAGEAGPCKCRGKLVHQAFINPDDSHPGRWRSSVHREKDGKYCYERSVTNTNPDPKKSLYFVWPRAGLRVKNLRGNKGLARACVKYGGDWGRYPEEPIFYELTGNERTTIVYTSGFVAKLHDDEYSELDKRGEIYVDKFEKHAKQKIIRDKKLNTKIKKGQFHASVYIDTTFKGVEVPLRIDMSSTFGVGRAKTRYTYEFKLDPHVVAMMGELGNLPLKVTAVSRRKNNWAQQELINLKLSEGIEPWRLQKPIPFFKEDDGQNVVFDKTFTMSYQVLDTAVELVTGIYAPN